MTPLSRRIAATLAGFGFAGLADADENAIKYR